MPKKGYKHPENCNHCIKQREMMKGNQNTKGKKMPDSHIEATRKRMLGNKLTRPRTEEQNKQHSETMKRLYRENPELAKAQSERMKGNKNTLGWVPNEEWRKKQSELKRGNQNLKGWIPGEDWRRNKSEFMRGNTLVTIWWNNATVEEKDLVIKRLRSYRGKRPTSLEKILKCFLVIGYDYDLLQTEYYVRPYSLDIAIPELKLNFEADGYWSHRIKANMLEYEIERDAYLSEQGWTVIRFPEEELKRIEKELSKNS